MYSLITGGAGFIGSHVAKHCIGLGHSVVILDDLSGGRPDNVPAGAELIRGSICDSELCNDLFTRYKFTYVYHLAAYAAEGLSHFIRRFNYETNVIGSVNLINAAVNIGTVERFVYTSSIAIYGKGQVPMVEDMSPAPEDPYGIAKFAVELDLRAAFRLFGLPHTIFRPHNVYGEGQNIGDPYRNVIGIFMNQLLSGKRLTVFGDGSQTRAFSYIGDVAPIIAKCVLLSEAENEVFNVGADNTTSVAELAAIVARAFGVEANVEYLPARNEVLHAYSSHDKVRRVFGTDSATTLEAGIGNMAKWVRAVGVWSDKPFDSVEVTKNMPEVWQSRLLDRSTLLTL